MVLLWIIFNPQDWYSSILVGLDTQFIISGFLKINPKLAAQRYLNISLGLTFITK